jgi:hypothetical protein
MLIMGVQKSRSSFSKKKKNLKKKYYLRKKKNNVINSIYSIIIENKLF